MLAIKALCTKVIQICTYISTREKLAKEISSCIDQYESMGGKIMEIAQVSMDWKYPPQVALELLKDVRKIYRDVKVKAHKFYSNMPSNEAQRLAIDKLAPLVPINQDWYFQEV